MSIMGLDKWLTTPPEEPDWIEEAEKMLKRLNMKEREWSELESDVHAILSGLLDYIDNEC